MGGERSLNLYWHSSALSIKMTDMANSNGIKFPTIWYKLYCTQPAWLKPILYELESFYYF